MLLHHLLFSVFTNQMKATGKVAYFISMLMYQRTTTIRYMYMYMYTSILVHLTYIKPGGVSDKLCVFPADES